MRFDTVDDPFLPKTPFLPWLLGHHSHSHWCFIPSLSLRVLSLDFDSFTLYLYPWMMTSSLQVLTVDLWWPGSLDQIFVCLRPWTSSCRFPLPKHCKLDVSSPHFITLSQHILPIMMNCITCQFAIQTRHLSWICTYLIYSSSIYIYWIDFQIT